MNTCKVCLKPDKFCSCIDGHKKHMTKVEIKNAKPKEDVISGQSNADAIKEEHLDEKPPEHKEESHDHKPKKKKKGFLS